MARPWTLMVWTVLGALALGSAAAQAQSAAKGGNGSFRIQGVEWTGVQAHGPAQRIPDAVPLDAGRPVLAQAEIEPQNEPQDQAQAPATPPRGRVRIQGRDAAEPQAPLPVPSGILIDLRERMRGFVQSIATFARRQSRDFQIVTRGGLELMIKRDPIEETRFAPARAYIRSLDAVMVDGLNFDHKVFGEPPPATRQRRKLMLANLAKDNGLKVFVIDYAADPKTVDESRRLNREKGFISTAVHQPLPELTSLPPYPARPFGENPKSILSLRDVSNFAYLADSSAYGRVDEFAMTMHANNFDLLIVDVFHRREPLSKRAVETLKYKKLGARRLVFATVNIGTAASYHYYWKPDWREGSPPWIAAPLRDDPDRYYVQYWRPEWQRVISGDTQSYVYGLIAQGFDGVILEGLEEAFRFFEGPTDEQEEEQPPAPTAEAAPATAAPAAAPGTPPATTQ
ncbi:MAG: hypothetical protein ACE5GT_10470 [Rhodospirillales bacterium]